MRKSQRGFVPLIIILVVAFVLVGGAYMYMQKKPNTQPIVTSPVTQSASTSATVQKIAVQKMSESLTEKKVADGLYKSLRLDNHANWTPFMLTALYGSNKYLSTETNSGSRLDLSSFGFGDINNDGYEDAVFVEHNCGVSCSVNLSVALQQPDGALKIMEVGGVPIEPLGAGKTDIQSIVVKDGKISITARGFSDAPSYDPAIKEIFTFDGKRFITAP